MQMHELKALVTIFMALTNYTDKLKFFVST